MNSKEMLKEGRMRAGNIWMFGLIFLLLLVAGGCSTVRNTLGTLSYVETGYDADVNQIREELKKKTLVGRDCRAFLASGPVIDDILQKSTAKVLNNVVIVMASNGWGIDGCYEIYADKSPDLPDASPTDFPIFVQYLGSFGKIYKTAPAGMVSLGPSFYGDYCTSGKSFNYALVTARTSEATPRFYSEIINFARLDELNKAVPGNKRTVYNWGMRDVTLSAYRDFFGFAVLHDCLEISGTPVKWAE